ncbi:hypothetical protein ACLOJK_020530 [Asimina triloba]
MENSPETGIAIQSSWPWDLENGLISESKFLGNSLIHYKTAFWIPNINESVTRRHKTQGRFPISLVSRWQGRKLGKEGKREEQNPPRQLVPVSVKEALGEGVRKPDVETETEKHLGNDPGTRGSTHCAI